MRQGQQPQRATQGFVSVLSYVWNHPSLTAIEVAWRWVFGVPALYLLWRFGSALLNSVPWSATGVSSISANQLLTDPMQASNSLVAFASLVGPGVSHALLRVGPLLLVWWVLLSTVGRTLLLRRLDRRLQSRPATLLVLQLLRLLPIVALGSAWWFGLQALAERTIVNPVLHGGEPQMMVYVAGVIVLSLGLFVAAAGLGWIFTAAPVLAMRYDLGSWAALKATAKLRQVRASLFEINMVLAVVKIMLLVLALAFSAFPLPFANVITEGYIVFWSAVITLWYFAASDLFHVARLRAYCVLTENTTVVK